jgi:hypothetical protein
MGQFEFTTLVSPRTRRDEKGAPIIAPSIHIGALVGAGSCWPKSSMVKMDSKARNVSHYGLAIYI